jgi:hypothetical protein
MRNNILLASGWAMVAAEPEYDYCGFYGGKFGLFRGKRPSGRPGTLSPNNIQSQIY